MRVSSRFFLWTLLWGIVLGAMWFGARAAGRAFDEYMLAGDAPVATALAVLPAGADGFVFEPDLVARWRLFRRWKLDASLQEYAFLRPFLETWGLAQPKVSPFERFLLAFWPKNLAAAWSTDASTVWLAAPVGNRWETARWLIGLFFSAGLRSESWRVQRDGSRWWIDVEDPRFVPEGSHAQLAFVRGVAVLAIGPKGASPLAPIFAANGFGIAHGPEAAAVLGGDPKPEDGLAGLVWIKRPGHAPHAVTWRIIPEESNGQPAAFVFDLRIPSCRTTVASAEAPDAARLGALAQADDFVDLVGSRADLGALRDFVAENLPRAAAARVSRPLLEGIPEAFRPLWKPVFDKFGDQIFVGVGNPEPSRDRRRFTLPRLVLATPFEDSATLLNAVEQTILRCHREGNSNWVIRKRSSSSGDFYRVLGADAFWTRNLGLPGTPVFGFAKGLLLVASDSGSLENAMERVATEAAAGEPMRGVRVRASLPRLGGAFRTGLLAAGALLDDGNADLISASALQRMDETLAAFRNFGEARVDLEREPGAWKLRARLTPARPP